MRKFYQLLLLIFSLFSIVLFLVYRHEYNRLHYVLEVFNFFGQPCNISGLHLTDDTIVQHDWGPIPTWFNNGKLHTYSGFWTEESEVKVIAVQEGTQNKPANCYLWFEDRNKPIIGKFRYSIIGTGQKSMNKVYFYYCNVNEYPHSPYAVSFTNTKMEKLQKVLLTTLLHKIVFNTTVCVVPSIDFSKDEFIEFLSFHMLIGVNSFIFYSDNIPYRLQKIITNLSNRLGINITFFPWNIHNIENNIDFMVVNSDCKLRALSNSNNVITLKMNEYIVPSKFYTLNELIKYFNNKASEISLPVQTFCVKNINYKQPVALQNFDVSNYNHNLVREIIINNSTEGNVIKIASVNYQIATIHKYIYCKGTTGKSYPDNAMIKYSTDFLRSTLVQLKLHDQL